MKPLAWSYSSLDTFVGCARKYHQTKVLKAYVEEETAATIKGTTMHKHFEDRIGHGVPLPGTMAQFEYFMIEIDAIPGETFVEHKVGLNRKLEPCGFFDKDVWWRGVLDVEKRLPDGRAIVIDYKTGKPHTKMRQLHLFSIYCFLTGAHEVESMYYWTQNHTKTRIRMPKAQLPNLLQSLVEDLKAYKEAFDLDIWPPQQNYLCQNYCPVRECEFWGVKWKK